MRSLDWSRSPVGPIATWPNSLRTAVGILLHSQHPMFLWWGAELIQLYNDAYLPILSAGRHPGAMGRRAREGWQSISPEVDAVMKHGEPIWHDDACIPVLRDGQVEETYGRYGYSPVFIEDGSVGGVLVICTFISELERAAIREHTARQTAEVAKQAKDDFLATVSHELRTPLTAILGWARMLIDGKVSPPKRDHALTVIERNAVAQAHLIDDLLDVSRITAGNLRLQLLAVDLARVLEAAIDSVRPALDAKGIALHIERAAIKSPVMGDPNRLQQVIWNLLVNAAKFTPKGGRVQVELTCGESQVELRVDDNGRGISAELLPQVFDRFKQADTGNCRSLGGLGLGLAISRHLVELHRGRLDAYSEGEGRGSSFVLTLPLAPALESPILASTLGEAPSLEDLKELEGLRVLIVDDEEHASERLASFLAGNGAIPIAVHNAADAVEALVQYRPDVVLSDIAMPGEDGYSFIRRVRRLSPEQGAGTPAAALTVFTSAEDRSQALIAGYQMHIPKPVEPAKLVAIVANLARIARSMK